MGEVKTLIEGQQLQYTGLFRVDEFYQILKQKISSRGYYIEEQLNREDILETGKQVVMDLRPIKTLSDYEKAKMKVDIHIRGIKDKVITIDGHKQKYQQGEIRLVFFAYHVTDYRNKWEDNGFQFLLRTLMDKFVRHNQTHQIQDQIKKDCNDLIDELRAYLNMTRFKISHDLHPHKD